MAIPPIAQISLDSSINRAIPGIPFVHKINFSPYYYVKVFIPRTVRLEEEPLQAEYERLATNYFLEHYFPEYYPLIVDIDNSDYSEYRADFESLKETIENSISFYRKQPLRPRVRVYKLTLGSGSDRITPYDIRAEHEAEEKLPDFEDALEFFNNDRRVGEIEASVSFQFTNYPSDMDKLGGFISEFTQAITGFQTIGTVPPSLAGDGLGPSTKLIINTLLDVVYESVDLKNDQSEFFDTDYVRVYFDDRGVERQRIVRIEYFILNVTRSETMVGNIGFITNSKYNPVFKDVLALNTIRNYRELIDGAERSSNLGQQFPLFSTTDADGFRTVGAFELLGSGSFPQNGGPLMGDIPGSLTPGNNIFANRSTDDLIDISAADHLQKVFSSILTKDELQQELEQAEDEATKKRILQSERAKKLNAGIQITNTIDSVLNFNFPLGPNAPKEAKAVFHILNQFGISALAKEAIICLTLGLGATASRITQSVRNSIVQTASSLRAEPTPPSKELGIERPSLGEQLQLPFSVNGDIHKQIANIILGAVANAAFEIIKSLTELIQFNCNSILRGPDRPPVDVGEILRNENDRAGIDFPNLEEKLQAEFAADGLQLQQVYQYFSDVSLEILDPIEICRLLNSQTEVEQTTYNNILQYNETYPLQQIRDNVNTISAINGYFASMSRFVDTVTICNDIINNNIAGIVENCEICLDEDFFEASPALEELIRISEEGIQIQPPQIDFLCPDSPNYLENPIATRILPDLFDTILNTTRTYMAGSLEAARTSLLDLTVLNDENEDLSGSMDTAGVEREGAPFDPAVLDMITDLFDFFSGIGEDVVRELDTCQDVDSAKVQSIIARAEDIVGIVRSALEEVPAVIEEVNDKISSIQEQGPGGPGEIAHTQEVFPEGFKLRFKNAIQPPEFIPSPTGVEGNLAPSGSIYASSYTTNEQVDIKLLYRPSGSVQKFEIQYPEWTPNTESYLNFSLNLDDLSDGLTGTTENVVPVQYRQTPVDESYQDFNINPYVYRFVQPILFSQNNNLSEQEVVDNLIGEAFPSVYGSLYRKLSRYVLNNGAFTVEGVKSLKFFANNDLCAPGDVGDLFDTDGILDQMKKEYAAAACFDNSPDKDKVRNTLYYGLILMLIQTIIDEFIIKNIIVFTAFRMEDVFNLPGFRDIMINEIVKSFRNIRLDGDSVLERELYNYFDRLSIRPPTINNGGIRHTYSPFEIPPGFELNPETQIANFPLGNDYEPLIRFLVEERLFYTWDDGQRTTLRSIGNIIDPEDKNKSFDDIFLEDVITVQDFGASLAQKVEGAVSAGAPYSYVSGLPGDYLLINSYGVMISHDTQFIGADENENLLSLNLLEPLAGSTHVDPELSNVPVIPLFSIPTDPNNTRQQNLALIKQDPQYQLFKNQVFNQDAIMLGLVLQNFYLTNRYFSDISDSFRGTKRAIINFMNMTDASSRPPVRDASLGNSFVDSLANNGEQGLDSLAREIFLKFLRETPIQILKGLVELIDPHIAISKIIKTVTGEAFIKVSQALQTAIDAMPDEPPNPIKEAGITGEDVLAIMFCLYQINQRAAATALLPDSAQAAIDENNAGASPSLFPNITLDGVDFKGSILGMFMAPPSPLGIIYLLIDLLKNKIDEDLSETEEFSATEDPPPEEC